MRRKMNCSSAFVAPTVTIGIAELSISRPATTWSSPSGCGRYFTVNVYDSMIFSREFGSPWTYRCTDCRLPALRAAKAPYSCTLSAPMPQLRLCVNERANREKDQSSCCDHVSTLLSLFSVLIHHSASLGACPQHSPRKRGPHRLSCRSAHRKLSPERSCCVGQLTERQKVGLPHLTACK